MGSIASVLQWRCEQCSLINPTEKINCVRCGSSRDGENIGWIGEDGDLRENSDPRGAASPPTPSSIISNQIQKQTKNYSTWGHFNEPSTTSLRRCASFNTLIRRWECEKCFYANVTVCSSCIGCGYVVEKDYLKTSFKKRNIMDSFGSDWFSANHDPSSITPVEAVDSPKKQLPSMYERVKNKVSRSLSNGSVVQKLLLENSPKGAIFKRPTSLLVDNSSPSDVNKNVKEEDISALYAVVNKSNKKQSMVIETWTCPRCTLENSVHFDRCEVCETPKKKSLESTIPKNGVVITVPEWDNTDVDVSKQTTALYKSIKLVHKPIEPKMSPAETPKPLYRRCHSEVNTPSPEGKVPLNRRSMIETDVQNNLMLKSPLSNANRKVGLRYSYIGITEPELCRQFKELRSSSPISAPSHNPNHSPCTTSDPTDIAVINTTPIQDWQSGQEWSAEIAQNKRREFFESLQSDLPTLDARSAMSGMFSF